MIIIDLETGGLDPHKNSILSIGAVDYDTGDEFYIEAHDPSAIVNKESVDDFALAVNGLKRETISTFDSVLRPRDMTAYARFVKWSQGREPLLAGQQVGSFDVLFLKAIHERILKLKDLIKGASHPTFLDENQEADSIGKWSFGHRTVDLHSIAYAKFGKSLSLDGILEAVGLQPEPKPHNALTGARLERDAFKILLQK